MCRLFGGRWLPLALRISALVLTHAAVAAVAYYYRDMLCGIAHAGYSAPASVAFLAAVPFLLPAAVLAVLSRVLCKKTLKEPTDA